MLEKYGAPGGIRTPDHLVRSQVLYGGSPTIDYHLDVLIFLGTFKFAEVR